MEYNVLTTRIKLFQHVKENTVSLWSYIIAERRRFLNPFYNQYPRFVDVLRPNTRLMCIKVWKDYYFRYNPAIVAQDHMVIYSIFLGLKLYLTILLY